MIFPETELQVIFAHNGMWINLVVIWHVRLNGSQWRIQNFPLGSGAPTPLGECQTPMRAPFGGNRCENERIGSRWRRAPVVPAGSANGCVRIFFGVGNTPFSVQPAATTNKDAAVTTYARGCKLHLQEGLTLTTLAMDTIGIQGEGVCTSYSNCMA